METIISEIVEILKGAKDAISRETQLLVLFGNTFSKLMAIALERLDAALHESYKKQGWKVQRRDQRTILSLFGTITYKRRLMKSKGKKHCYPVDRELGWEKRQRFTPLFVRRVAEMATKSTYRATATAISLLTSVSVSHQSVSAIVRKAGNLFSKWEKAERDRARDAAEALRKPSVLYLEGDGLCLKKVGGKMMETHRLQLYEGILQDGSRRKLKGCRYFADVSHASAFEQAQQYIDNHYDLGHTLVISNSDGGAGYGAGAFAELASGCQRHEHFLDRYHLNEKVKERLNFTPKRLQDRLHKQLQEYSWEGVTAVLDTALAQENCASKEAEQVERLRQYLKRNWSYIKPKRLRNIEACAGVGSCESNHRIYSYRMKRQGRVWSSKGGQAMIKLITALRNNALDEAMTANWKGYAKPQGRNLKKAARRCIQNGFKPHVGVRHGGIANYGPSTNSYGRMSRALNRGIDLQMW